MTQVLKDLEVVKILEVLIFLTVLNILKALTSLPSISALGVLKVTKVLKITRRSPSRDSDRIHRRSQIPGTLKVPEVAEPPRAMKVLNPRKS